MGRTKRQRLRKKTKLFVKHLSTESDVIKLMKWMNLNDWNNFTNLRLGHFTSTGRGVFGTSDVKNGQILLEIPFDLMISYTTLENSSYFKSVLKDRKNGLLTICDLLAIFILFENHLGEESEWKHYLNSFPKGDLYQVWLCSDEEMRHMPKELEVCVQKERDNASDSVDRVLSVINGDNFCEHCNKRINEILTEISFIRSYILVNTRCVYVCPEEIYKISNREIENVLLDDPNSALCPFMDMINHSNTTTNSFFANKDKKLKYGLETGSSFKKYDEIFISYGLYDNKRLLSQYGFILPHNNCDNIQFTLDEIISISKLEASSKQYRFLRSCKLHTKLTIDENGYSFNMAAVLYVLTNETDLDWPVTIYSYRYSDSQLSAMDATAERLLKWKWEQYTKSYEQAKIRSESSSRHFAMCVCYMENRVQFVEFLIKSVLKKSL